MVRLEGPARYKEVLRNTSLVARHWRFPSQRHLLAKIYVKSNSDYERLMVDIKQGTGLGSSIVTLKVEQVGLA